MSKPLTYGFDYNQDTTPDRLRPYIMAEFAANGAKHITLTSALIRQIMHSYKFGLNLKQEIKQAGLSFLNAHAPFGPYEDLNVPDPVCRAIMLDRLRLALRIAADFGVDSLVIHVGNIPPVWRGYTLQQLHESMLASLEELIPLAAELKITIAIENIWFPTSTPAKLIDACQKIDSPYLGICYDAGHANLMKRDRNLAASAPASGWRNHGPVGWDDKILEKVLPYVTTCHIHDNYGQKDSHLLPGQGNVDWPHVINLLHKAPRLKNVECEVAPLRSYCSIAELCETIRQLWETKGRNLKSYER